jgi:hypothetical protein
MVLSTKLLQNKNNASLLLGAILIIYLYLGTPVPANLILQNFQLVISVVFFTVIFSCLYTKVNIFVAIIFALVAFEVIRKSLKPDLNNLDKNIQYYNNIPNKNIVISNKLKNSDSLEQEMVNNMKSIVGFNYLNSIPKYKPVLSNSVKSSQIE